MAVERLQKIMAASGIASRRKAEEIIAAGRVTLNGKVVTEQGTKADPERDEISVDGKPLKRPERLVYYVLNKPKGYVTTVSDPEGRPTVMDLLRRPFEGQGKRAERVYPVGRLDYASEGLLLLTNDGALAHRLTRAASHVPKTYQVKVSGKPTAEAITSLRTGNTPVGMAISPDQKYLIVGNDEEGRGGEPFLSPTYACRPPGVFHGPFKSERGCLLFEIHYYDESKK